MAALAKNGNSAAQSPDWRRLVLSSLVAEL